MAAHVKAVDARPFLPPPFDPYATPTAADVLARLDETISNYALATGRLVEWLRLPRSVIWLCGRDALNRLGAERGVQMRDEADRPL